MATVAFTEYFDSIFGELKYAEYFDSIFGELKDATGVRQFELKDPLDIAIERCVSELQAVL